MLVEADPDPAAVVVVAPAGGSEIAAAVAEAVVLCAVVPRSCLRLLSILQGCANAREIDEVARLGPRDP